MEAETEKRKCISQGCKRALPNGNIDAHNFCILCRPKFCSPDNPCPECKDWPDMQRRVAQAYQIKMANQRARQAKARAKKLAAAGSIPAATITTNLIALTPMINIFLILIMLLTQI